VKKGGIESHMATLSSPDHIPLHILRSSEDLFNLLDDLGIADATKRSLLSTIRKIQLLAGGLRRLSHIGKAITLVGVRLDLAMLCSSKSDSDQRAVN
jgi:hypothetical protein